MKLRNESKERQFKIREWVDGDLIIMTTFCFIIFCLSLCLCGNNIFCFALGFGHLVFYSWNHGQCFIFLSTLLRDCSLCWDLWSSAVTPTLDAALLSSSRVGADLGQMFNVIF